MDKAKRKRLEKAGWKFGDADDFLGPRLFDVEGEMFDDKVLHLYVPFFKKRKKPVISQEIMPEVFVDLDKDGNVLGVEVHDPANLVRAVRMALKLTPDKLDKGTKLALKLKRKSKR